MATKSKKSNVSIQRNVSKSSMRLKNRDKKSSTSFLSFEVLFKQYWNKYCTEQVPKISVIPSQPGGGYSKPSNQKTKDSGAKMLKAESFVCIKSPEIVILYDSYEFQMGLNTITFKNFTMSKGALIALRKTLEHFDTLRTLKLDFCNLLNTHLRTLKSILMRRSLIQTLSINGNPNSFQNFYILIKNTSLNQLCLRFCQINDRGAELISQQLKMYDHPLRFLDLSSNYISDVGVKSICQALRINRSLLSLNLADNWITDDGCINIMDVLQKFPLQYEEFVIRRRRILEQTREKVIEFETQKPQFLSTILSKRSSFELAKTKDKTSRSQSSSASLRKDSNGRRSLDKFIKQTVESISKRDNHPFVRECFIENGEVTCRGNFSLMNLNLSYNKITQYVRYKIMEVVFYQKEICKGNCGLMNILLEGCGEAHEDCQDLNYINCLETINTSLSTSGSLARRQHSMKKRLSVSRRHSANI